MRVGILTDVHEHVSTLREALDSLRAARAHRIVNLGDVCEDGTRLEETLRLLEEADVTNIWGNHDLGLCTLPGEQLRATFPDHVVRYARTFVPRLVIGDCYFSHIEPALDADNIADLWNPFGPPEDLERLERNWRAVPQTHSFMGHVHRWHSVSTAGVDDWAGDRVLALPRGVRRLVVVDAISNGAWALLDTDRGELIPHA